MANAVTPFSMSARNAPSFRMVGESYLEHGGSARYLQPVVDYFNETPVDAIVPFDVHQMAKALYPNHAGSTLNRQAITPARAVLIHGYERGWCPLIRLRRFKQDKPNRKSPANQTWLHLFTRQCDLDGMDHLAALVLFMAFTGARVSEAIALRWPQVDLVSRRVMLLKTKTDTNSPRFLTDELVGRLQMLQTTADLSAPVFRYTSRYSVNERIQAVCARAGIPYKSSHACGRHSFATNAIALGMDVKTAMEAGGWKSSSVFLETYVHSRNAGRLVADAFNQLQVSGGL
jgi:integrase